MVTRLKNLSARRAYIALGVVLAAVALPVLAATFNLFQPAAGILKGNPSTYVTTAATSADVVATFSGTCNSGAVLKGDGTCAPAAAGSVTSVALTVPTGFSVTGSPVTTSGTLAVSTTLTGPLRGNGTGIVADSLTGVLKGNGTGAITSAVASDVYGLWSGCTGSNFLRGDGVCTSPGGGGSVTSVGSGTGVTASPNPIVGVGTLAVDQAFSPTWSGVHLFTGAPTRFGTTSLLSPGLVSGSAPLISMVSGSGGTDAKSVELFNSSGAFTIQNNNDAGSTTRNVFTANRTASSVGIASLVFGNTTDNAPFTIQGTGHISGGGSSPAAGSNMSLGSGGSTYGHASAARGWFGLNGSSDASLDLGVSGTFKGYVYASNSEMRVGAAASTPINFYPNDTSRWTMASSGGMFAAGATGGDQGVGTLNTTGLFVNGSAVGASTTASTTFTLGGCSAGTTGSVNFYKIGKQVQVMWQNRTCTSTGGTQLLMAFTYPAGYEPNANALQSAAIATNNNTEIIAKVIFSTSTCGGGICFQTVPAGTAWTGTVGNYGVGNGVYGTASYNTN